MTTHPTTPRRIGIFYTGGTIGMEAGIHGLAPSPNLAHTAAPFLRHSAAHNADIQWHIAQPLIDSSAITLTHWQSWLKWIQSTLPHYDALLILHGTDTLAYTAALFALALPGLDKPVVLTGAQWPLGQDGSDAPLNLYTALAACCQDTLRHVLVAFNGNIWRAVGCSKVSTEQAAGFATAHFPPLAELNTTDHTLVFHDFRLPESLPGAPAHTLRSDVRIACLPLTPGANADIVASTLNHCAPDGVVLQTYGHGNAPDHAGLLAAVEKLCARGVPVLNISQVPQGCAAAVYAQGAPLRRAGVINAGRCNTETAIALLTLAASEHWPQQRILDTLRHWQLLPE